MSQPTDDQRAETAYREACLRSSAMTRRPSVSLSTTVSEPLGCDCYGGCWGDHSADWSVLTFTCEADAKTAARLCHQNLDGSKRIDRVPYGETVVMGKQLRFADPHKAAAHDDHMGMLGIYPALLALPALTFAQYEEWVSRTKNHPTRTPEEQRAIFALGVGGEAGEVCDLVKKYEAHGREVKREELGNEIGDVLWYLSALCSTYGLTLEECAQMNEAKLRKRWPNGFAPWAAR